MVYKIYHRRKRQPTNQQNLSARHPNRRGGAARIRNHLIQLMLATCPKLARRCSPPSLPLSLAYCLETNLINPAPRPELCPEIEINVAARKAPPDSAEEEVEALSEIGMLYPVPVVFPFYLMCTRESNPVSGDNPRVLPLHHQRQVVKELASRLCRPLPQSGHLKLALLHSNLLCRHSWLEEPWRECLSSHAFA